MKNAIPRAALNALPRAGGVERDASRTQWLGEQGFRMLRFSDHEALMQTEAVLTDIQNRL